MKHSASAAWISSAVLMLVWVYCAISNLQTSTFWTSLDRNLRDQFLRIAVSDREDPRVAIIDLDESSLQRIGAWPWKRSVVADLVEKLLLDHKVASVGLDMIFPQADGSDGDFRLAALGELAPLTFAYVLDYTVRDEALHSGHIPPGSAKLLHSEFKHPQIATGYMGNHEGLRDVRCAGNIGYIPDEDGVIRSMPLSTEFQSIQYPSLSQALLACTGMDLPSPAGTDSLWKLPFKQSAASLMVVSAADVIEGAIPQDMLRGRHVLVGSSSLALGDHVSTPLNALVPGVLVHAAALSGLLDVHSKTTQPSKELNWVPVVWLFLSFLLLVAALRHLSPLVNMWLLLAFAAGWIFVAYTNITLWHIEHPIFITLWGYALVALIVFPLEWWITRRKEHILLKTFSSYVGKPVLNELMRHGLQRSLDPSLKEVTVMVVDLQGYTKRIMELPLTDAADFTRRYLECLTAPILDSHGTLDKYMGDGLVAFWGAPLPSENHADQALECAAVMLESIKTLSSNLNASSPPMKIRIGIESGMALVGDLGTSFRSSYTAVGDCINLASRLENLAKELGISILVGPETNSRLQKVQTVSLGKYFVRDTNTELEVFTPQ